MAPNETFPTKSAWQKSLESPNTLLGTFLQFPSPQLVETIGYSGFDFIIIDFEHGEYDLSDLSALARAAEVAGLHKVVRVWGNEAPLIGKALDFGADAVLVPHIESADDARKAVAAAKYAPEGNRGSYPFMRATQYRTGHRPGWEAEQNAGTSVILLVEGERGVGNIKVIVHVPGVAAVFVGPVDLSQALGIPGQLRHPKVEAFAKEIMETAHAAGIKSSIFCNDMSAANDYAALGFKLIAFSVDAQIISDAYRQLRASFQPK